MEMDSMKKSLKMGALSGGCTYLLYVVFIVGIGLLTRWQNFWVLSEVTGAAIFQPHGAISWEITNIAGLILASLVPVFLMKYEQIKYAFSYIGISLLVFIWLYATTLGAYFVIGDMTKTAVFCPFATFDALYYLIFVFLLGSAIGTVASFVLNFMRNKD